MRPLRGLIACLGTLVLVTVILTVRRSKNHEYDTPASAQTARSRLRALFSFRTPDSLFPPSAIISLTDDNSTFFLARPAAYGAYLPSDGLSGQLWVGGGFGEADAAINAEGELGCSDIPGWPNAGDAIPSSEKKKDKQRGKTGSSHHESKQAPRRPARALDADQRSKEGSKKTSVPSSGDRTDDYLHWPLKGAPLLMGDSILQKTQDGGKDSKDKEHADIQSIQESAEIAGKVVLLSRGGCGFLEKSKWVQRRGGVALIVGDNVRGASLITMYANGDTSNVTIPSIFTSHMSAQLLSTLTPPGGLLKGLPLPEDLISGNQPSSGSKKSSKQGGRKTGPIRPVTTTKAGNVQNIDSRPSWLKKIASVLRVGDDNGDEENRRYPNSGRISWVQADSGDEESPSKQQDVKTGSNIATKPKDSASDGFVIGVHDWRDPDLVALQKEEANQGTLTKTTTSSRRSQTPAATETKTKAFSGGNAVPGSGRYSIPAQGVKDQGRNSEKSEEAQYDQDKNSWLKKLFASDVEMLTEEEALGLDELSTGTKVDAALRPPLVDTPGPREGLWVTITPTTMSSSPFFDTLLVLVISPLVTLTVVYALLLLRARIQRRRWRAPKSVVERLPVRVYHTMSTSSTSTSSLTPSVDTSSATSPLLQQPDPSSTLSRTRPRSRTTTSINESAALTLERQREDLASRLEKKRYRGRQVECSVCLEEYVDGQSQVMSLPCGHEFHAECITPWLTTRRRTCPICKGDVVRSLAASSSANRSVSSSPSRSSRQASRTHSLDRSGSPRSDTPLLQSQGGDVERGRGGRLPNRSTWQTVSGAFSRLWDRRGGANETSMDRDR